MLLRRCNYADTPSLPGFDHTCKFTGLGAGSKVVASYMVFQCTKTSGTGQDWHLSFVYGCVHITCVCSQYVGVSTLLVCVHST